jgi:hypothetical protein
MIILIGTTNEESIKLATIIDGTDECRAGFIPRAHENLPKISRIINKICPVIELYHTSDSLYKKKIVACKETIY